MHVNPWIARSDPPFACWEILFGPPGGAADLERLAVFSKRLVAYGRLEQVYDILETPSPSSFLAGDSWSWADHVDRKLELTGELELLSPESGGVAPCADGRLRTPAVVAWFPRSPTPAAPVEAAVEDLGALLEQLRPEDVEWGGRFMARVAPVTVLGQVVRLPCTKPVRLQIALFTDIWFPWVLGFLQDIFPATNPDGMYDNRNLCWRHTPRLNRFLAAARELTLEAGGSWSLLPPEPGAQNYHFMLEEDSILLDD